LLSGGCINFHDLLNVSWKSSPRINHVSLDNALLDKQRIFKSVGKSKLGSVFSVSCFGLHGICFSFLLDSFLGLSTRWLYLFVLIQEGRKEVVRSGHSFLYLTFISLQKLKKPRTKSLKNSSILM
jgi:hypothetical protein